MGKVGLNEVQGQGAVSISLDTFREQVNYVNPKNKGYVRFTRAKGTNEVTLGKVNNFCDLFSVSWRTNVDAAHNRALRDQMVNAIRGDLAFVDGASRDKILNLIRSGNIIEKKVANEKNAGVGETSTKALARRELKALFEEFDKVYNTREGRKDIVTRMLCKSLKGLIPITEDLKADYKTACDYLENVLKIKLTLLDPPLSENDGIPDAENPNHRLISEAAFRAALAQAQNTIKVKKEQHTTAVHIVDSFVQGFALNGDLMDYTLPDKLKMDPERLDCWTQTLETLIANNQKNKDGLKLSEWDFKLLNCRTAAIGTPTFLRMYIQEVLGYRLKSLYNTFATKLEQPDNKKYRDELMGLLQNQQKNGMSRGDFDRFQLALGKVLGSKGKPFDLYQTIVDDAIKYSEAVYKETRDFVDAKTSELDNDMLKPGFADTKSGKTFRNLRMSKAVNEHIVEKLKKDGRSSDEINGFLSNVRGNGYALAYEVEAYHATMEYCAREFDLPVSTDYETQLTERWAEELKRLDVATNRALVGGGLGKFSSDAMDIVFGKNAGGIVDQLHADWKLDKKEIGAIMGSDLFKQALNLTTTQLMSNIGNSEEIKELLSGNNANKAAYLLSRTSMLVYHEFESAKNAIADQVKAYGAQLMSLKGSGDMTKGKIKEMVEAYRRSCESNVVQAVRQYLTGVELKPTATYLDIISQGRVKKTFWEKAEDFLGLSSFTEDLATPKLEKMIAKGLAAAEADCQLTFVEKRLELTKVSKDTNAIKPNDLRFDRLLAGVEKTVQGEEMPTLFSLEEDKAQVLNTLRGAVLTQTYVDVFKEHQNTYFTQSLIDNKSRQLDQEKAVAFKDKFETKAEAVFTQFTAYQDAFVGTLRHRLTDAVVKLVTERLPGAKQADIMDLAKHVVNDLIAHGAKDIREGMLTLIRMQRAVPVIKEGREPADFNSAVDEVGELLYRLHAQQALEARGKMVLEVLRDGNFAGDVCSKTVNFLKAENQLFCIGDDAENPAEQGGVKKQIKSSIAERALLAVYAELEKEIRACPALWSIKGKEGVAELIRERLSFNAVVERIRRYDDVYRHVNRFFSSKSKQEEYANSLPPAVFEKIWMKVVNEKLPAVPTTQDITLEHALDIVKADVKARIDEVVKKLEEFLNSVSAKYDPNKNVGGLSVAGQLKLFVDELLHGESTSEDNKDPLMSKNFVDRMSARYPLFEKLVTSGVQEILAGRKIDSNQVTSADDLWNKAGTLRHRIFTELMNVLATDSLENTKDQVDALKRGALQGERKEEMVAAVIDGKMNDALVSSLDSLLLKKASKPVLREYGAGILEGISQQANTLLEEYVSDESIIAGLADRVEAMNVPGDIDGTEKEKMLGVMNHVKRQLEQERKIEQEAEKKVAIFRLELDLEKAKPNERAKIEDRLDKAKRGVLDDEVVREVANRHDAKFAYTALMECRKLEEKASRSQTEEVQLTALKDLLKDYRTGTAYFDPDEFTKERYDAAIGLTHSDALIQLRHHLSDEINKDDVYAKRQKAAASAFTLGFELFANTPMTTVVDGQEVLKEEFKADRDNLIEYRDGMQTELLNWWRTNMRLNVAECDVRAAMINLDAQLELKGIDPAVAQTVRETVGEELKAMRDAAAEQAGVEVNKTVKQALDGTEAGGLNEKIDDILWVVASEKLATEYKEFVEKQEAKIFNELITVEELQNLGVATGVLSEVKDSFERSLQNKVAEFRGHLRHVLMEMFGFTNPNEEETAKFSDKVKTLAMLRSSKEEVVKKAVERLRKVYKPELEAKVNDEREWMERLNDATLDWMLRIAENLFGKTIDFRSFGKLGEDGYVPKLSCREWLRQMLSTDANATPKLGEVLVRLFKTIVFRYSSELVARNATLDFQKGNLELAKMTLTQLVSVMCSWLNGIEEGFVANLNAKYTGVNVQKMRGGVAYLAGNVTPEDVAQYITEQDPFAKPNLDVTNQWYFTLDEGTSTEKGFDISDVRKAFESLGKKLCQVENARRKQEHEKMIKDVAASKKTK